MIVCVCLFSARAKLSDHEGDRRTKIHVAARFSSSQYVSRHDSPLDFVRTGCFPGTLWTNEYRRVRVSDSELKTTRSAPAFRGSRSYSEGYDRDILPGTPRTREFFFGKTEDFFCHVSFSRSGRKGAPASQLEKELDSSGLDKNSLSCYGIKISL